MQASTTRVDRSKWEEGELSVGDKKYKYKYRRPTAPEKRRAMVKATQQVRADGLPTELTELLTQTILLPDLVSEVDGEPTSKSYWDEVADEVESALRTEIFGYPGELFLQQELIKNLVMLPNLRPKAAEKEAEPKTPSEPKSPESISS